MNRASQCPPQLLTSGRFDTTCMRPSIVKTMQKQIRNIERKLMPCSGHISMIDNAGLMNDDVLSDFLGRIEIALREDQAIDKVLTTEEKGLIVESSMEWSIILFTATVAFIVGVVVGKFCKYKAGYAPIE